MSLRLYPFLLVSLFINLFDTNLVQAFANFDISCAVFMNSSVLSDDFLYDICPRCSWNDIYYFTIPNLQINLS